MTVRFKAHKGGSFAKELECLPRIGDIIKFEKHYYSVMRVFFDTDIVWPQNTVILKPLLVKPEYAGWVES